MAYLAGLAAKQDCGLFGSIPHGLGDGLHHPFCVLLVLGVVLHDDQGVPGIFQNGPEPKDVEDSAYLEVNEPSVNQLRIISLSCFADIYL